ncbi:hypothetical protein [Methylobacterium sp. sgz302541]|uniref:hypothetical protein n=1 Tax=unclassified Methylobacterium TaxID=2615210 RepID=UPI003D34DA1F
MSVEFASLSTIHENARTQLLVADSGVRTLEFAIGMKVASAAPSRLRGRIWVDPAIAVEVALDGPKTSRPRPSAGTHPVDKERPMQIDDRGT